MKFERLRTMNSEQQSQLEAMGAIHLCDACFILLAENMGQKVLSVHFPSFSQFSLMHLIFVAQRIFFFKFPLCSYFCLVQIVCYNVQTTCFVHRNEFTKKLENVVNDIIFSLDFEQCTRSKPYTIQHTIAFGTFGSHASGSIMCLQRSPIQKILIDVMCCAIPIDIIYIFRDSAFNMNIVLHRNVQGFF